jgi:hypothetical protein
MGGEKRMWMLVRVVLVRGIACDLYPYIYLCV